MTANAMGNVVNTAFVDGIGVSVFSCNMVFPRFFLMCVCISKNWAFL